MRTLLAVLAGVTLLVGAAIQPASAAKGTDIERFMKRVGKFAVYEFSDQKPRGLCVCLDSGPLNRVGTLAYFGGIGELDVRVYCYVPSFNPDGSIGIQSRCDIFEVLSK